MKNSVFGLITILLLLTLTNAKPKDRAGYRIPHEEGNESKLKEKEKENCAPCIGTCECRPCQDTKTSCLAIKAAQDATQAQQAQQVAGAQAALQVKAQLAHRAEQAAKAAEAALSAKQSLVDQLEYQVREALAIVQEECASCQERPEFGRIVSSFDSKCPLLKLVNGRSRYRWRGRSVRFNCMRGFQLVGVKYATCMNGKWDADVPICVKYGCRAPSTTHVNGQFIESYRGAVVKIVCNPGYTLVGPPSVYCNGIRWNETFPVCRVKSTNPALFCDFEDPDLCGWSQDPMHDFDWKRQNGSTSSGNIGYYMYMESSSPRMENDTARLYSPVYPSRYSNGTCFKFWYHMYGATTGFLRVFVKPEGVELYNLIPSFWINGEQGKSWIQSFFLIEPTESPFQIVIEGVRGSGAVGDTAFDDVRLTSANECKVFEEMSSSTEFSSSSNPDYDVVDFLSCKGRCSEEKTSGTITGTEDDKCNCYETCDRDGTCCSDYFDYCSPFPSTPSMTTQTYAKISSSISSSPSIVSTVVPKLFSSHHFNNESNDINPKKPFVHVPLQITPDRTSNEIPRQKHSTTLQAISKTTTTPRFEPQVSTVKNGKEVKSGTGMNTTKAIQRKIPEMEKKAIKVEENKTKAQEVTAKASNEIPREREVEPKFAVNGKSEGNARVSKSMPVTSPLFTTTARAFKVSKPNNIKLKFLEKPSNPNLSNEAWFNKEKQKEFSGKEPPQAIKIDKSDENSGGYIRGIIEVVGTALAILVIIILGIFWYKRRKNRKSERENMVEDSDSIVCKMDSSTLGSESHSLVCIRSGGLQKSV